jgi:hypothetical protein
MSEITDFLKSFAYCKDFRVNVLNAGVIMAFLF